MIRDKVLDGTPCGPDTFDICVHGLCKPAGCDHILDSTAVLDTCGVCGGDNTTCQKITGSYNSSVFGHSILARIPTGSSNIDIKQYGWKGSRNDNSYLGRDIVLSILASLQDSLFALNRHDKYIPLTLSTTNGMQQSEISMDITS